MVIKYKQLIFAICFVFLANPAYSQYTDYVVFSPLVQSVTINSGEEIEVEVTAYKVGANPQYAESYDIESREIPDNGYISRSNSSGSVQSGAPQVIKFKFKKIVSSTLVTKYRFWGVFDDRGTPIHSAIDITITYQPTDDCNQIIYPTNLNTNQITTNSAKLNWSVVTGNLNYQYQYRRSSWSPWTVPNTTSITSRTLSSLEPSTSYDWRVRTECEGGGAYSNWSPNETFITLPECISNREISLAVTNGEISNLKAQNTTTATNIINTGGTANYDAGVTVFLKPGFNAKSGSIFKAFIEGCSVPSTINRDTDNELILIDNRENEEKILEINYINVYPNPVRNSLFIKSDKDILTWSITDFSGKEIYKGRGKVKQIDTHKLYKGIYILRVRFKNGELITKKIVKE